MSTIHKKFRTAALSRLLNCFRGGIAAVAVLFASSLYAQCGFEENGYLFMHPYFSGTNWKAPNWTSDILLDSGWCAEKPVNASASGLASQGTFVYTIADGSWMMTNGPLEDNDCPCCRPRIIFETPLPVTLPPVLALQPSIPFHLLRRGAVDKDTVYLTAASTGGKVYCLHISTRTGKTGAVDTLSLTGMGTSTLSGVWGEPDGSGNDTALWVGGSSGFLRLVPFTTNRWGTARSITIDNTETVTAIGGGYLGTLSGKLFRRSGNSFAAVGVQGASALRRVSGSVAVGDGGTVLVNRGGSWQANSSGASDYRLGNLTANGQGAVVELVDKNWAYSVLQLSDSATSILSITPAEVATGLNTGVYRDSLKGILTVSVRLRDIDNNRIVPVITLKHGATVTRLDKADDGTVLLRHNPSAICSTGQAYLNDTLVKLILDPTSVSVEAVAVRGNYNASCMFWNWENFLYEGSRSWVKYDTLMVTTGKDTLRILNSYEMSTEAMNPYGGNNRCNNRFVLRYGGGMLRLIPGSSTELRRVMLVDAAGRCVWQYTRPVPSGSVLLSPALPGGIHFLRIEYRDGSTESRRLVLVDR